MAIRLRRVLFELVPGQSTKNINTGQGKTTLAERNQAAGLCSGT